MEDKMLKLIGAVMIIAVCAYIGFAAGEEAKHRQRLLEETASALELLKSEICFSDTELKKAFINIDRVTDTEGIFARAAERIEEEGISRAWNRAVESAGLDEEDEHVLKLLSSKIGKTDSEGQRRHIEYTASLLRERARDAKEIYEKNGKIYRSVGFLAGAAAVLLLI